MVTSAPISGAPVESVTAPAIPPRTCAFAGAAQMISADANHAESAARARNCISTGLRMVPPKPSYLLVTQPSCCDRERRRDSRAKVAVGYKRDNSAHFDAYQRLAASGR